jgi:HSP20 family molecular chaperone IbpA
MSSINEIILYGLEILDKNENTAVISQIANTILQLKNNNLNPPVDIIEEKNLITIFIDIPGILPSSIDINFFNNKIEISGERVRTYNTINVIKKEIVYGRFYKEIILPLSITKKESVTHDVSNGVLNILIDKTKEIENKFKINL